MCDAGRHSNRGSVEDMCPIFLINRRFASRDRYKNYEWWEREELLVGRKNRRRRARAA